MKNPKINTVNLDLINECRFCFNFSLPSELLEKRIAKFQKKDTKALATYYDILAKKIRNLHSTCKVWKKNIIFSRNFQEIYSQSEQILH